MTAKSNKSGAWISQLSKLEKNQNTGIRKARRRAAAAHRRIENLKDFAFGLAANNDKQAKDIGAVNATVATIVAGVPAIIDGLTQLQGGLVALQGALENTVSPALTALSNGLTQINAALNNTTTGLVGLNLARPQFGVFNQAGTILGGTGQVAGGSGPSTDAAKGGVGPPDIDGLYVVDFGNDVSLRQYTVNVIPYIPTSLTGGGTTPYGSAVNCAANATIDSVCDFVLAASGGDPQNVLVQIGDGSSGGAVNGFSVTALSG